ncbi:hypothetical protein C2857_004667 [Epichloe festucae Fl1]|uniref:Ribonuclease n=1 Tax=Epichloe festucae (strain Fl1) TaxID=877507 RepID=A0A7S9KV23_EPIFF|nr:hypothetical protein C2857_004667 [Epichloe festucae Fl1]
MDEADDTNPPSSTFIPPSIHHSPLVTGASFTHYSPVPPALLAPESSSSSPSAPAAAATTNPPPPACCLGVDEAGRGPVLGPMVYGVFYLPLPLSDPLLRQTHHFDDSKVLTPAVRASLMRKLCTPSTDLHSSCGWATASLSARDIAANMLRPDTYNLNAQAMDATVDLIRGVLARGVNVHEIYVDTIGQPAAYQARLQRVFPATKITVAKKADSLYPCVSAASVCAKVTRDAALEELYRHRHRYRHDDDDDELEWGSGYPSDARCVNWMRRNMHPVFGWGPECRFSWGTAKDMLEGRAGAVKVDWPAAEEEHDTMRLTDYFGGGGGDDDDDDDDELGGWYGSAVGLEAF